MEALTKGAAKLGLELTDMQLKQFERYMDLLLQWNEKFNLTAITEKNEIISKHFLDSLTLLTVGIPEGASLIDIGAGAGFPSLPVKIARPDLKITMLDSLNKRVDFLRTVIVELALADITALHSRAEDGARTPLRESFDLATARAVANLSVLAEYALPFVKVSGNFVAMKGTAPGAEVALAERAVKILGGRIAEVREVPVPQSDLCHSLVIINKVSATPSKYPRKAGKPAKEPLS